jgi:hypothetical protein
VFLTVNGHDHINSFIGSVKGIDIANAPGSSYTSYGSEEIRGVRLFRFSEYNVRDYETLHVRYSDYNTPQSWGPLKYFFSTTSSMPFYNAIKVVVAIGLVFIAMIITCIVLVVKAKQRKVAAVAPAPVEAPANTPEEPVQSEPNKHDNA